MELDLVIIGGGYWGAGVYEEVRRQLGWEKVIVLDDLDPRSGSRNASAICDPDAYKSSIFRKYWPQDWTKEDLRESLNWLVRVGGGVPTQEMFWNVFLERSPRPGAKAIYLSSNYLVTGLASLISGRVNSIQEASGGYIIQTNDFEYYSRRVVVTAGYRTPGLLPDIEVDPLYGRGIVATGIPRVSTPISVMIRPYCKHTVRDWQGRYGVDCFRVGDTAETTPNDNRLEDLRLVGSAVLDQFREVEIIEGYRPVAERFLVEKLKPGLIVATGGHRLGLGLTGLVANKVVRMLNG